MDYLEEPIVYLQRSDFNDNGELINPSIPKDKPVLVMFMANFCGYCKQAKPALQELANKHLGKSFNNFKGDFVVAVVQADGDQPGEKEMTSLLPVIDEEFRGYPHYALYRGGKNTNKQIKGRGLKDLEEFVGVV